jgi:hypothetical protein
MRQEYSFTKRNVLDTCPRAYFYEYFAANNKVEFDAGRKARIKEAKQLSSVHLLGGIWLHQFIRRFLGSYPNVPADLEQECCAIFDNAVSRSRSPARRRNAQGLLLLEYVFDDPEAEERATLSRETLIRAIRHFRETPQVREVWEDVLRGEPWIEKPVGGLPKVDGYGIRGQIDFAVRHGQRVRIVDWKSGLQGGGHDSLQLFIYALWANKQYGIKPEAISVRRVFLGEGRVEPERGLDATALSRGEARLVQDVALMREQQDYGKAGVEEAFTPCLKVNVCRRCKFQRECPEGRALVESSRTSSSYTLPVLA